MSQTVTFEIPEAELASFEAMLDKTLAALSYFGSPEDEARQVRMNQMRDETRVLIQEIKKLMNVEEVL